MSDYLISLFLLWIEYLWKNELMEKNMKQLILKHKAVTILLGLILIILLYETCYGIYLVFHFSLTVDDIETLSAITGREYYGTEITDIKTHTDFLAMTEVRNCTFF